MKKIILSILLLYQLGYLHAQETFLNSHVLSIIKAIQEAPFLLNGHEDFQLFIQEHLHYPERAIEYGIEGEVILLVDFAKETIPNTVEILEGIGFGCDREALRLMRTIPTFKLSQWNDQQLPKKAKFIIQFRLQ